MGKIQYQRFSLAASEGATTKKEFDFDAKTEQITGVQITSTHPDKAYFRGSQRIEVNGQELFPEGYESRLLMSSPGVSPDNRFHGLGEIEPGNKKLKVAYTDTDHASAAFAAYNVILIFKTIVRD